MKKEKNYPLFIDFEASSLSVKSYPIEVAWSLEDGTIEGYLINPDAIEGWTDWDVFAESIHGISKEQLSIEGKDPKWVVQRMNEVLDGKVLLTNAYEYDLDWCETLFKAAGEYMLFNLGDAWYVFGRELFIEPSLENVMLDQPVSSQVIYDELAKISKSAWKNVEGGQHRAGVDVQQLIEMWRIVSK
ncbi:MAG TPA: hypothetical protein ENH74_01275 [Methylophaga sp.]|nr:hypothetical protein [Methylophaga sp.]HEC58932.1 hypothetical protein [Methylophaga sp.]